MSLTLNAGCSLQDLSLRYYNDTPGFNNRTARYNNDTLDIKITHSQLKKRNFYSTLPRYLFDYYFNYCSS